MKFFVAPWLLVFAAALGRAATSEAMIVAAMKLSDEASYSWVSTVTDDARTYDIEGKTERGGYTWVRLPMVDSIARRLGSRRDSDIQAVFRGSRDCVILTENGWLTLDELPNRDRDRRGRSLAAGSSAHLGAGSLLNQDPFGRTVYYPPSPAAEEKGRRYSNAQFGVSFPHEELGVIISSCAALEVEGDTASGSLADAGAQLLLVRDGQEDVTPVAAAGRFKLWRKGALVLKYSMQLEGILLVKGRRIHIQQSVFTEVRNVGETVLMVPDEARRKFAP